MASSTGAAEAKTNGHGKQRLLNATCRSFSEGSLALSEIGCSLADVSLPKLGNVIISARSFSLERTYKEK